MFPTDTMALVRSVDAIYQQVLECMQIPFLPNPRVHPTGNSRPLDVLRSDDKMSKIREVFLRQLYSPSVCFSVPALMNLSLWLLTTRLASRIHWNMFGNL